MAVDKWGLKTVERAEAMRPGLAGFLVADAKANPRRISTGVG